MCFRGDIFLLPLPWRYFICSPSPSSAGNISLSLSLATFLLVLLPFPSATHVLIIFLPPFSNYTIPLKGHYYSWSGRSYERPYPRSMFITAPDPPPSQTSRSAFISQFSTSSSQISSTQLDSSVSTDLSKKRLIIKKNEWKNYKF